MKKATVSALVLVLLLAGCVSVRVDHQIINRGTSIPTAFSVTDTYAIPRSLLVIEKVKGEGASNGKNGNENDKLVLKIEQGAHSGFVFGITPKSRQGVITSLTITKRENTNLVEQIDVDVEDKRTEFIGEASSLIGTVISTLGLRSGGQEGVLGDVPRRGRGLKPGVHDLSKLLINGPGEVRDEIPVGDSGLIMMKVEAVEPNARLARDVRVKQYDHIVYHSGCREAVLTVGIGEKRIVKRFALADPRYLVAVGLPLKGKINAHAQCGLTVAPEKAATTSDLAVLKTLLEELGKLKKPGQASRE